ncbi:MAG: S41 family peptidase [Pseudomonadales bacterium]
MIFRTLAFSILLLTLTACNGGSSSPQTSPISPPVQSLQSKLQGTWEQSGYGEIVVIEGTQATSYQFTRATCVLGEVSSLQDISNVELADNENTFVISEANSGFVQRFERIDALPDPCITPTGESPTELFEHVWHTFRERYAFFTERNVDWLAQYDAMRDQINDEMTDNELFIALATLILPIDDAHVSLVADEDIAFSPAQAKGVFRQLLDEFDNQDQFSDLDQYFDHALSQWTDNLIDTYLDEEVMAAGGPDNDMLLWGTIGTNIGYLRIDRMLVSEQSVDEQLIELAEVLDEVFTDLADTTAMIVDIRINQGGTDAIGLAIANRFADRERMAVRKFARSANGDTVAQEVLLQPIDGSAYLQPTVLITSGTTTSAAEVFALAMREIPHVTHIGEPTNGSISDALDKTLPNGWQFSLANEVYSGSDGIAFEAVGIRPDAETAVFDKNLRQIGQDSGLNTALHLLDGNR